MKKGDKQLKEEKLNRLEEKMVYGWKKRSMEGLL